MLSCLTNTVKWICLSEPLGALNIFFHKLMPIYVSINPRYISYQLAQNYCVHLWINCCFLYMYVRFVCCGIAVTLLLTPLCTGSHSITSDPIDPSPGCWFSWGKASGRNLTCPLTFLLGDKVIAISLATTVPEMRARARGMIKVETSCPFITGPNIPCQRAHTSRGLTDWTIVLKTKAIMWWKESSYN